MAKTIGNPLTWTVDAIKGAAGYFGSVGDRLVEDDLAEAATAPKIRRIQVSDLRLALQKGVEDFASCRTDVMFLCIIYPVVGIFIAQVALNGNLLPLLFPVMSGFALIGPVAAVGLYEMSRRREKGLENTWASAFGVVRTPSFGAILVLAIILALVFAIWIAVANLIYDITLGPEPPVSPLAFARDVLTTGAGWAMIVIGVAVGFLFAVLVLAVTVVSFPLLLDRNVGLPLAVMTSVRVTALNTVPIGLWGLVVATALVIGSAPLFLGLIVILPILGHATWHLYRLTVGETS